MRLRTISGAVLAALGAWQPARAQGVAVRGVVFDSLRGAPLGGAVVTVVGTARITVADARGRFRVDSVPPGVHVFAAHHAAIDSVGFPGISTRATVTDGRAEVRIAVPAFATLWRAVCGAGRPPADSGFVYGTIRDASRRAPVAGATVDLTWLDLGVDKLRGVTEQRWRGRSRSDVTGSYGICGVPTDVGLSVRAYTDSAASGLIDLPQPGPRVQRRDLLVGPLGDSGAARRGTIAGVVADTAGRPFAGARVVVDELPEVRSGSDGRFTIPRVPAGTRQVEVLAIGMLPVLTAVDVVVDSVATLAARVRRVTTLDVVRVTGSPYLRRVVAEFAERRRSGFGYVRDSTQLAGRGTLASVFAELPSVQLERGVGSSFVLTLPHSGRRCVANVVIDGFRSDHDQLGALHPADVAALEVYPRRLSVPDRFVQNAECGVVVVWTKWAFR